MSHIEQNKNKLKNNIFLCRMKRVLRKKSRQKNMENLNQESIVGVQITDKKRNSVDRFFTHQSAQKGYFESNSKPLNLSPNFRQTLSPNIKSCSKNSKHLQQVCSYMSQIAQIQKNRNNLSLIFSSTFHRPLWKSVQLRSPKKTYQSYIGKCAMFRQNQQEEAQIQFYNTNNIFILKKKINQKSEQTLQLPGPQIKPASIKYKKNQSYRLCTQIQPKQIATQRPNRVRSIKFKTKTDSIKNIESYITQREDPIHTRKTEQNRFVQGLYSLQPWNHMTDQQKLSLIRASPLVFH